MPNLDTFVYSISLNPDDFWVRLSGNDVSEAIRQPEVADSVSAVAGIPAVRTFMKELTRSLVEHSNLAGVVVEGRDITTVVAPDAKKRILLTADEEVRLRRRSAELSPDFAKTLRKMWENGILYRSTIGNQGARDGGYAMKTYYVSYRSKRHHHEAKVLRGEV
jgi:cytidylate kinase